MLSGRNGVGKSTVLDAVDFALTGTISKYEVQQAKGGGLAEHLWWVGDGTPSDDYVLIGLVDDAGNRFEVKRSRTSGLEMPAQRLQSMLCHDAPGANAFPETFLSTTLIRDELIAAASLDLPGQARFNAVRDAIGGLSGPDYTSRVASVVAAATKIKEEQDVRTEQVQAELGRTLSEVTKARSALERQTDVAQAHALIQSIAPDIATGTEDLANALRSYIVDRKQLIVSLERSVALLEQIDSDRTYFASPEGTRVLTEARGTVERATALRDEAAASLARAEQLQAAERADDEIASHFVALLSHGKALGLQHGHCPLCDALRSEDEFKSAIAAALKRLGDRATRVQATEHAMREAQGTHVEAEKRVGESLATRASLEARQEVTKTRLREVASVLEKLGKTVEPPQPAAVKQLLLVEQEQIAQLERALYTVEASSAQDRFAALQKQANDLRATLEQETAKLARAERALELARQVQKAAQTLANQVLAEQFDTVMPLLKELFKRLRPHTDWREIDPDFGGQVRASLNFTVGEGRNPQFIFSSGQRRAAGIAFLLAIHLARPWCRLQSLLLDDPVQHIDDYRALNLVEVLAAIRRSGRQVVIAVEDAALATVLCRRLRSTGSEPGRHFEIGTSASGSATIERTHEIYPLPKQILEVKQIA